MNEIDLLKKRISDLEYKLNLYAKPDGYDFRKSYTQLGSPKLGFYGSAPIIKPSSTGATSDMTVVGGAAVTESNGFGGDTGGPTYYTINDIVKHLKTLGLLTD